MVTLNSNMRNLRRALKSIGYLLSLGLMISCAMPHCHAPSIYKEKESFEYWGHQTDEIATCLHDCILSGPSVQEYAKGGAHQIILIDFSRLKEHCPSWTVRYDLPFVCIESEDGVYRLEFRWVGRECSISRKLDVVSLEFVNVFDIRQMGVYLYRIYDPNGVVWEAFLYNTWPDTDKPILTNYRPDLSPCIDQIDLRKYKRSFLLAP